MKRENAGVGEVPTEQIGALGLVVNTIVLWNTIYMVRFACRRRRRHPDGDAYISFLFHCSPNPS